MKTKFKAISNHITVRSIQTVGAKLLNTDFLVLITYAIPAKERGSAYTDCGSLA